MMNGDHSPGNGQDLVCGGSGVKPPRGEERTIFAPNAPAEKRGLQQLEEGGTS